MQKTGPQRVPPCRSLHLQWKIGISTCNKKTTFLALAVFFPFFLSVFNCGWMVFNYDCMLFKSKNKANLYRIKNFTLFKKAVVFIKILLKNAKRHVSRRCDVEPQAAPVWTLDCAAHQPLCSALEGGNMIDLPVECPAHVWTMCTRTVSSDASCCFFSQVYRTRCSPQPRSRAILAVPAESELNGSLYIGFICLKELIGFPPEPCGSRIFGVAAGGVDLQACGMLRTNATQTWLGAPPARQWSEPPEVHGNLKHSDRASNGWVVLRPAPRLLVADRRLLRPSPKFPRNVDGPW